MTVFLKSHKLLVSTAPKIACTSIKYLLFKIENGFEFQRYVANGITKHIHNVAYPARPFESFDRDQFRDYLRLTVVRDPVSRLLSCYSNRIVHYREASRAYLTNDALEDGLTPDPSLDQFIAELSNYRKHLRSIRLHSNPMVTFLGDDSSYYHRIYRMEELPQFNVHINEITGTEYRLERRQTDGPKYTVQDLSKAQIAKIQRFYRSDYRTYGRFL